MKTKLVAWLFLLGVAMMFAARAGAALAGQPPGEIKALRVRGAVYATVKATGARTPLADNARVAEASTVTTSPGGSVVLSFSNGASVNLGADSSLEIEQFTQEAFTTQLQVAALSAEPTSSTTRLKLNRGELVSKVAKLNAAQGSTFVVTTPVGAAGIRGTTFRIVYRIDAATGKALFSLSTLEGTVSVTLTNGAVTTPPVDVTNSQEVSVTADVDANGNVTLTLPSGATTVVATNMSTATNAEVAASAEAIAQSVANVVFAPAASGGATVPVVPTQTSEPVIQPINPTVVSPSQ